MTSFGSQTFWLGTGFCVFPLQLLFRSAPPWPAPWLSFLFSSAVCLPACMLSQPDETSSLLSVCLSLAGRFHTTMASCLCNSKASFVLLQPAKAFGALPLLAQLASMCLHAAALPALHTFLHNTLHLPVRVAPPEHHNQSKIH